jgi:hypothetical protein
MTEEEQFDSKSRAVMIVLESSEGSGWVLEIILVVRTRQGDEAKQPVAVYFEVFAAPLRIKVGGLDAWLPSSTLVLFRLSSSTPHVQHPSTSHVMDAFYTLLSVAIPVQQYTTSSTNKITKCFAYIRSVI